MAQLRTYIGDHFQDQLKVIVNDNMASTHIDSKCVQGYAVHRNQPKNVGHRVQGFDFIYHEKR